MAAAPVGTFNCVSAMRIAVKPGASSRRGNYSPAPLTEPDVRAPHPAPWIGISEHQ